MIPAAVARTLNFASRKPASKPRVADFSPFTVPSHVTLSWSQIGPMIAPRSPLQRPLENPFEIIIDFPIRYFWLVFLERVFSLTHNFSYFICSNPLPTAIDLAVPKKKRSVRRNRVRRYHCYYLYIYLYISKYRSQKRQHAGAACKHLSLH